MWLASAGRGREKICVPQSLPWIGLSSAQDTKSRFSSMIPWLSATAIHLIILGLVLFAGAAFAGWGLFGDRSKGRARCPRCRYDMRGRRPEPSGLICPECGYDALKERQLYKNHR